MTQLRKRMLEELQRRNYSPNTIRPYLYAVEDFARYFGKSPDKLGQEHLRQYQMHLVNDCKLTMETIGGRISALRFFFVKTSAMAYDSRATRIFSAIFDTTGIVTELPICL